MHSPDILLEYFSVCSKEFVSTLCHVCFVILSSSLWFFIGEVLGDIYTAVSVGPAALLHPIHGRHLCGFIAWGVWSHESPTQPPGSIALKEGESSGRKVHSKHWPHSVVHWPHSRNDCHLSIQQGWSHDSVSAPAFELFLGEQHGGEP